MAGSVNKVILIGNLGRDPEVRSTQDGRKIGNLSIATSESWRDKSSGERKERTEWHRVVIWPEGLVGIVEKYLRKGDKVYIEGQLETRKWTDKDGNEKYTTEVVLRPFKGTLTMLETKSDRGGDGTGAAGGGGGYGGSGGGGGAPRDSHYGRRPANGGPGFGDDLDDEIPF